VGARAERKRWVVAVRGLADDRGLRYEPVGGLNPRTAPAVLCPGGSNRLTGELTDGFWGASCDALEREEGLLGGLLGGVVLPQGLLIKAHMPDLTEAVPRFDVESIEARPEDQLRKRSSRRVEFESIEFNRRFLATVPREHDPVALRELFSPGFLTWANSIDREVDFGALDSQLYLLWRLRERTRAELELALRHGGTLFERLHRELEGDGLATYEAGPWNAGLEEFPAAGPGAQSSG
jgi:hypothetical protein